MYKIVCLLFLLGLGIITVVLSVSCVLFGIPFTVLHVDHLFNGQQHVQQTNAAEEVHVQSTVIRAVCTLTSGVPPSCSQIRNRRRFGR